jgi:disulfide bond formation protein DsbB
MSKAIDLIAQPVASAPEIALSSKLHVHLPIPETLLMLAFVIVGISISVIFKLPISLPSSSSLAFTGMGYTTPIIVIVAGLLTTLATQRAARTLYFLTVLLAYGAILIVHFNIKLWVHAINPVSWDQAYLKIDQALAPLVNATFSIRSALDWLGSSLDLLYLFAFLAMFGCSIIVHSSRSFMVFRKVVLTAMLVHVLGALSYLIAPALGPFLYDAGANALETKRQVYMLATHKDALAGGTVWLGTNGAQHLATGLAAMPSLHVASSAVFVYYAWRYERRLCWLYLPLFLFIMNEAVATRWHYLVDIIAGIGLTGLAVFAVEYFFFKWLTDVDARQPCGQ